jgi:LysM repeat protein
MSREVKVAIGVLVCIIGLIVYVELNKKDDVVAFVEPIPEVTLIEEPVVTKPVPVKEPAQPLPPPVVEPKPVEAPPKPEVKPVPPKPVTKVEPPKPASDKIAPKASIPSRYTVQKGDTVSIICERELGSIKFQSALMESNPELQPHRLYPGIVLELPSKASLQTIADEVNSERQDLKDAYIVQKGDSLYGIATKQLGSPQRVSEIIKLNPDVDPRKLLVGTRLKLPKP